MQPLTVSQCFVVISILHVSLKKEKNQGVRRIGEPRVMEKEVKGWER